MTRSILVVDDVPEIVRYVETTARRYRRHELTLTTITSAREALSLASRQPYDLVISDLRMPEVDGLSILTAANFRNPRGRRVLMTGYNEIPATHASYASAKLDACVLKPMPMSDLLDMIGAMLTPDTSAIERYRSAAAERRLEALLPTQDGRP